MTGIFRRGTKAIGRTSWGRVIVASLVLAMMVPLARVAEAGIPFAVKGHTSNYIIQDTRVKNLDPFLFQSPFFPAFGDHFKATTIVKRYPADPRLLGMGRAKGTATVDYSCFPSGQSERRVGRGRSKFDNFGNAAIVESISANNECVFTRAQTTFKGNQVQPEGSSVSTTNVLQRLPLNAPSECFERDLLCLLNARFTAEINWTDGSNTVAAVPIATGYDEGFFFFFSGVPGGIALNILDTCEEFNAFSIFAQGATNDLGWDLTVTDTETGVTKTYTNPLGTAFEPITDTAAFATCP